MRGAFVHRAITLWTLPEAGIPRPHSASFSFHPDDPYAVEVAVPRDGGGAPHSVLFARELLLDGLNGPVGEGAVRVAPHPSDLGWTVLSLPIDGERVVFYAEQERVEEFVDATLALVPSSGESAGIDFDRMIAHLLEASP